MSEHELASRGRGIRIGHVPRESNDTQVEERGRESGAGEGESQFRHVEGAFAEVRFRSCYQYNLQDRSRKIRLEDVGTPERHTFRPGGSIVLIGFCRIARRKVTTAGTIVPCVYRFRGSSVDPARHLRISARRCRLFEQTICPVPPARRRGGPGRKPSTCPCLQELSHRSGACTLPGRCVGKRPPESGAPGQAAIVRERRARALGVFRTSRLSFASPTARCGSRPAELQNSAAWSAKAAGWRETNSSYRFSARARHRSASAALPSSSSMRANWAA